MVSKRLSIYGFISAATVVSGLLVGCGGSSSSVQGLSPTVQTTGGVQGAAGTATAASSTAPQQVQVTVNGTTQTAVLPAGETANGTVGFIGNSTPIINGLTLGTSIKGEKQAPASGTQGQVYVDGQNTGVIVTSAGALSQPLILSPGVHTIHAQGPFAIVGGTAFSPQTLTVGQFNFGVLVGTDGVPGVPTALDLKLPANGGVLNNGNFVNVTYPTPDFATGHGTLIISYGGTTVTKYKVFANGTAGYSALNNHPAIPATGVDNVTFNVSQ